ncbi:MAG: glucose-1-phosphate thymidylyltransferase [Chlorobi bacterium]|nr:glucose-1-phosphate thymidylyltransferase [Chlorobiota bacterium]
MEKGILIFEDEFQNNLNPLTYTRPIYDLRCGILTLKEKIEKRFPDSKIFLHTRGYLVEFVKRNNTDKAINKLDDSIDELLLINGAVLTDDDFVNSLKYEQSDIVLTKGEQIIAAILSSKNINIVKEQFGSLFSLKSFTGIPTKEINVKMISYPWNLVHNNGEQITKDFELLVDRDKEQINGNVYEGVHMLNKKDIFIGEGARIKPGAVLDAEEGPIFIDKNATVFPNTVIQGPTSVGENALIKIGAKIYGETTIGPVCKISGEIGESILHSYSNKQHNGFLGHAYLGSWVNIGAGTNNSDLKNNYGNVRVTINDIEINTGEVMAGLIMGDHAKSGIDTMFNTGTVVGVSSNVFGTGFPPKYIPSFSWGGTEGLTTFNFDKAVDVAGKVMARRNVKITDDEVEILRKVYDETKPERLRREMPE